MKNIFLVVLCVTISVSYTFSQNFVTNWTSHVGGPSFDHSIASCVDNDNNVYHLGTFSDSVTFSNSESTLYSNGRTDFYLIKYDTNGNILWKTSFGGSDYDGAAGLFVIQLSVIPLPAGIKVDALNNVYIFGDFKDTVDFNPGVTTYNMVSEGLSSGFLLKLNSDGEFIFSHKFENTFLTAFDVNSTGIYLSGTTNSIADIDPGPEEYLAGSDSSIHGFILKMSLEGQFEQAIQLFSSEYIGIDNLVFEVESQAILFSGSYKSDLSFESSIDFGSNIQADYEESYNGYFAKISAGFDSLAFLRTINSTTSCSMRGLSVLPTNEIIISGHFRESISFNILEGDTILYSSGLSDVFVLKITPTGEIEKVLKFGNSESNFIQAQNIDNDNNIYLVTYQESYQEVVFPNETVTFQHQGLQSSVLLLLEEDLNYLNHFSFYGGDFIGILSKVTIGLNNEIYLNAYFTGNPVTSFEPNSVLADFEGRIDGVLFKIVLDEQVILTEKLSDKLIKTYPNPFDTRVKIESRKEILSCQVFNSLGVEIKLELYFDNKNELRIIFQDNTPSGIYYLKVQTLDHLHYEKVFKNNN